MAAKYIHSLNLMLRGSNLIFVLKLITYPSQGDDIVPVRAKAVPEVLYMGIYGPVIAEEIIAPDVREQLVPRQSDIFIFHKIEKELIFFRCQIDFLPSTVTTLAGMLISSPPNLRVF